jgi:hypothetical protein
MTDLASKRFGVPIGWRAIAPGYGLAGAIWASVAALLASLAFLQLAFGISPVIAPLGLGRLDAAYRQALLFGAVSLPLAGMLLTLSELGTLSEEIQRTARWALALWNAALALGTLAILAGYPAADSWAAMPPLLAGLLWAAALLWAWSYWQAIQARTEAISLAQACGLVAATALIVHLGMAVLVSATVRGAGGALAASLHARGLIGLWATLAAFGATAALLPVSLGRPLFGRRLAQASVWGWALFALLSLPRDLIPDLLPNWLAAPVEAAALLAFLPALGLAAAWLGSLVGEGRSMPSGSAVQVPADSRISQAAEAETDGEPGATSRLGQDPALSPSWQLLLLAAVAILVAGMLWDAAQMPRARRLLQFGSASGPHALFPPLAGLWAVASALAWWLCGEAEEDGRARIFAATLLGGLALIALPLAPLGLMESAMGGSAERLVLQARLRLPGFFLLAAAHVLLLLRARSGPRTRFPRWPSVAGATSPAVWIAISGAMIAATMFVTVLLPLADPALSAAGLGVAGRNIEPDSLRFDGRNLYLSEHCAACHSQRVRDGRDAAFGQPMTRGDHGSGPAPVGYLRLGPDLAWAGDRYGDAGLLGERLSVHAVGGSPAFPWLFERAGPSPSGRALVEYLDGLRSAPKELER